jgi:hypothetical protein
LVAALLLLCLAAGCDSSGIGRTLPVAGKVFFDGKLWTEKTTRILFQPDGAKGNTTPYQPLGTVDESGNYTVKTRDKAGAPPGHYKVIVSAVGGVKHHSVPGERRPTAESLLPSRYGKAESTPLSVEVVESPAADAYDLKLEP